MFKKKFNVNRISNIAQSNIFLVQVFCLFVCFLFLFFLRQDFWNSSTDFTVFGKPAHLQVKFTFCVRTVYFLKLFGPSLVF